MNLPQIHESLELQQADLAMGGAPDLQWMGQLMLQGADCDQLPGATGSFGSPTNPIPVNGPIGERKYLIKLRGKTGRKLLFHRVGSAFSQVTSSPVDSFEVVCMDGTQRTRLTFSPYHPRRSNLAPEGFTLVAADPETGEDTLVGHGSTLFVFDFPQALPDALRDQFPDKVGKQLALEVELALATHAFQQAGPAADCNAVSATTVAVRKGSHQNRERIKNENRSSDNNLGDVKK